MLFLITIFLGAFLLFQVQPLIAKIILPTFGGGAAVWTACLLFFQTFLLFGYLYAHLLSQLDSMKKQFKLHALILVLSLVFLPIGVLEEVTRVDNEQPLASILLLLTLSIGIPYLLLAATGPLVQRWFSLYSQEKLPYQLYSLSNIASLIALLSFPFLIEPLLTSGQQTQLWSLGYIGYVVVGLLLIKYLYSQTLDKQLIDEKNNHQKPINSRHHSWLWLGLSTTGVVLLVATTNAMTQNIPPVPFLWVLPLCLYLLSFIISFHSPKWYVRWYWLLLFIPSAIIAIFMFFIGSQFGIVTQVVLYSSILFSACMVCHGELARFKPEVSRLTWFYLVIAFGGVLGSALVAFVAKALFVQFLEFPLAIVMVFCLLAYAVYLSHQRVTKLVWASAGFAVFCSLALWQLNARYLQNDVFNVRNFYGVLSVKDIQTDNMNERRLIDGTTSHGTQSLNVNERGTPLSYYRKYTGVALALEQMSLLKQQQGQQLKVGLIGLGAGTLAAYGKPGDDYRFYELNPAVINAAQQYFTYLADSAATITLVVGDGRLSLAKELAEQKAQGVNPKPFDVLVIDAFSGDSIPQHLLTVEAMALYWQHLAADGVIAVHISNSHLNLLPLMQGIAKSTEKSLRYFNTKAQSQQGHDTEWVWLTNNQALLNSGVAKVYQSEMPVIKNELLWTDDFSHLMSLLK